MFTFVSATLLAIAQPNPQPRAADHRTVALHIHMQDDTGSPINDAPFLASFGGVPAPERSRGTTDKAGDCTFDVAVENTPGEIVVVCTDPNWPYDPTAASESVRHYFSLISTHDVKKWYIVPLKGGETTASLNIVSPRGVAMKTSMKAPPGTVGIIACRAEGTSFAFCEGDEKFTVGGFVPGKKGTVLVSLERQDRVVAHQVTVPAGADPASSQVLEIAWPPAEEKTRPVVITMKYDPSLPTLFGGLSESVCLVSSDASMMYTFTLNRGTGRVESARGRKKDTEVAPGEYYVIPGDFDLGPGSVLFQYVKAARTAELDAAKIPKLVVGADAAAPATLELDPTAVWKQFRPLVDQLDVKR